MKISELIQRLEKLQEQHGDLAVSVDTDGSFRDIEEFEIVELFHMDGTLCELGLFI